MLEVFKEFHFKGFFNCSLKLIKEIESVFSCFDRITSYSFIQGPRLTYAFRKGKNNAMIS